MNKFTNTESKQAKMLIDGSNINFGIQNHLRAKTYVMRLGKNKALWKKVHSKKKGEKKALQLQIIQLLVALNLEVKSAEKLA